MKTMRNTAAIAVAFLALSAPQLRAQNGGAVAKIDPDAMEALKQMGEYLRTLDKFQVKAAITTEEVLEDGQKIEFAKNVDLVADRPNRLRLQLKGDKHERLFVYDGKTFTLYSPRTKYFATTDAPPTIAELAQKLEEKFAIELPLVDLFRWGTAESQVSAITAAKNVGESQCDGLTCQHYAFRQDELDWQVWIQKGEFPLPRKIVLTTLSDEARPQHTSVYTWNLAPSFNEEAFVFVPPADGKKITFADLSAAKAIGQK